jgi:hypothetical protein
MGREPVDPGMFKLTRTGSTMAAFTVNFTLGSKATSGSECTVIGTSVSFNIGSATAAETESVIDESHPCSAVSLLVASVTVTSKKAELATMRRVKVWPVPEVSPRRLSSQATCPSL